MLSEQQVLGAIEGGSSDRIEGAYAPFASAFFSESTPHSPPLALLEAVASVPSGVFFDERSLFRVVPTHHLFDEPVDFLARDE